MSEQAMSQATNQRTSQATNQRMSQAMNQRMSRATNQRMSQATKHGMNQTPNRPMIRTARSIRRGILCLMLAAALLCGGSVIMAAAGAPGMEALAAGEGDNPAFAINYDRNALATKEELAALPGVYRVEAKRGDKDTKKKPVTIGIPSVAKQNLENAPTKEMPAIIMGAAVNYETRTPGQVEYNPIGDAPLLPPYSYFRYSIMDEKGQDGQVHKKLSGFDESYYIIRVDVSDIISGALAKNGGKGKYLHVKQENNKAMMVVFGLEKAFNGDGTLRTASFANAGNKTATYSLADNAAVLKDLEGEDRERPYVDVVVLTSGKLAAGADVGQKGAPSADIRLSFYVDGKADYYPALTYDPNVQINWKKSHSWGTGKNKVTCKNEQEYMTKLLGKYYSDTTAAKAGTYAAYTVKDSDLEIDVATDITEDEHDGEQEAIADPINWMTADADFWSLTKAMYYPDYNDHIIRLICEVPVLEGLEVKGSADNARDVILDVNSFDIQIANNTQKQTAGLTVSDNAMLTIRDGTNTYGAELAISDNAQMLVGRGGTIVVDPTCQLEVEFDAASVLEGETKPDLTQGQITVASGGRLINHGVVSIEGMEGKPIETAKAGESQAQPRDMAKALLLVKKGGVFENHGCLSVKGSMYVRGVLINYGQYADTIMAGDPDKGWAAHHKGIQITWKDDVTQSGVEPGDLRVGDDVGGTPDEEETALVIDEKATLNNYGDIVLVPGSFYLYGTLNNVKAPAGTGTGSVAGYAGHIYLCEVDKAIIPIEPTQKDPTVVEKEVTLKPPVESGFYRGENSAMNMDAGSAISAATVKLLHNGVLGDLTPLGSGEICHVVYMSDGQQYLTQEALRGGRALKPEDPPKPGYEVSAWYKDSDLKNAWNFAADAVEPEDGTDTIILYAGWAKIKPKAPARAVITKVKARKGGKAVVSWKKVKGCSGYQLWYSPNKKFKKGVKKKTLKSGAKKVTVKKLKKGKTWYFKIRAYKKTKDAATGKTVTVCGKWSKVKKVRIRK